MGALDPADLIAAAVEQTGLDDFGDERFRDGLDVYAESVQREAALSELGEMSIQATATAALVNRLRVIDYRTSHPDVADEVIEAPIVVVGMFRAGTTLLSYLLDRDTDNRSLLRWESGDSVPPPTPSDFRHGPRVEASRAGNDMLEMLNPDIAAIHHEEPEGPTECIAVMSQDFKSLTWEAISNVPSYSAWLMGVDQTSAYEYHRDVLQVLQHGGVRGRWTLKSPHHAVALEALTEVYPDARLVLLHRDPIVLCASVCSLIACLSGTFSDVDHRRYIADHWPTMLEESAMRIDTFRDTHPEHPIMDVQYSDLLRDPVATVGAMYEGLGLELSDAAHSAMTAYVAAHPKGSRGEHHYDLARLGLNADDLNERFGPYRDRYGIESEPV
jgi:hypothetical protein